MTTTQQAVRELLIAVSPLGLITIGAFLVCLVRGIRSERNERKTARREVL